MQAPIPPRVRRQYNLVGPFDTFGFVVMAVGVGIAYLFFKLPLPLWAKITLIILSVAPALVLALGYWPMDDTGERLHLWIMRYMAFRKKVKRRIYG